MTGSADDIETQKGSRAMISVVIVSWNAKAFLVDCIDSLSGQCSGYPMEITVVDNASTDGSAEAVEARFPDVRLIRNASNMGFAKANNIGISQSTGQYLCLVNSDVRVLPDCLRRLVDYCEGHPEVGMVGPRVVGGDGQLQRSCRGFPTLWNMFSRALALDTAFPSVRRFNGFSLHYWAQNDVRPVDILTGCFWLVRREALAKVGLLDESFFMYAEDMDWCKRFRQHGWPVVFLPSAEAIHYGGGSSSNAPVRFFIEKQKADLQYWQKHHSMVAVAAYFAISCLHLTLRAAGYLLALILGRDSRQTSLYKMRRSLACLRWMFTGRWPAAPVVTKG